LSNFCVKRTLKYKNDKNVSAFYCSLEGKNIYSCFNWMGYIIINGIIFTTMNIVHRYEYKKTPWFYVRKPVANFFYTKINKTTTTWNYQPINKTENKNKNKEIVPENIYWNVCGVIEAGVIGSSLFSYILCTISLNFMRTFNI
jgi:hypothetical protein